MLILLGEHIGSQLFAPSGPQIGAVDYVRLVVWHVKLRYSATAASVLAERTIGNIRRSETVKHFLDCGASADRWQIKLRAASARMNNEKCLRLNTIITLTLPPLSIGRSLKYRDPVSSAYSTLCIFYVVDEPLSASNHARSNLTQHTGE